MSNAAAIIAAGVLGIGVAIGDEIANQISPLSELTKLERRGAIYSYPLVYAAPHLYSAILGRVSNRPFLSQPEVWSKISTRSNVIWPLSLFPAIAAAWAVGFGNDVKVSRDGTFLRGRRLYIGRESKRALKKYLKEECKLNGEGIRVLDAPFSHELECRHGFVVGGVGSGKTVFLRRLIDAARSREDKLLIHDVKGDFTSKLPGPFVLLAPHDARSAVWAIAEDIVTELDVYELAERLIPDGKDDFWTKAAKGLMVGWCLKLMREKGRDWGWSDLAELGNQSQATLTDVMRIHNPIALSFIEEKNNMTSSVEASLKAPLQNIRLLGQAWPSGDMRPRFSFRKWLHSNNRNERTVLFQFANHIPVLSATWINLAVELCAGYGLSPAISENPKGVKLEDQRRVWFVLDELPVLKKLPALEKVIAEGRSKGFRVFAGVQSWEQLVENYGPRRAETFNDITATLVVLYSKGKSAARMSEEFGDAEFEVLRKSQSIGSDKRKTTNFTPQFEKRRVLLPSDFEKLGKKTLSSGRVGIVGYMLVGGAGYEIEYEFVKETKYRPATIPAAWTTTLSKAESQNVQS